MKNEKNFEEFLEVLRDLTQSNLDFLKGKKMDYQLKSKYLDEIRQIEELINNFQFVKNAVYEKKLLEHPIPQEIKKYFGASE